tara:strand:+ start:551 stop:766 length:216 start_codon:yes stop_codon:yes gene_type:complete
MRCRACDALLTDYEATRKSAESLDFIDLCNNCYRYIAKDVVVIERLDLKELSDEEETQPYDYDEEDDLFRH